MWNKIVNPKTGRKVNVNSKIGKSVLRNYMKQLGGVSITESQKPALIRSSGNRKLVPPALVPEQELDDQKRDLSVPLKQPRKRHFFPSGFFDEGFYTPLDKKVLGLN